MVLDRLRTGSLGRYWRTARHLRPIQVENRLRRRFVRGATAGGPPLERRSPADRWRLPELHRSAAEQDGRVFRLLGRSARATGEDGWEPEGVPRLWRYHLHYFDDAASGHGSPELAREWLRTQPPGQGTGWEPYPLSRRIPNWIIARLSDGAWAAPAPEIDQCLAIQARALAGAVEYHLLGNHLLANLRALIFAGCFFAGPEADRWLERGVREWNDELDEQILADGGHQERSPMYHSLVLGDLLDLLELARLFPRMVEAPVEAKWRTQAGKMSGWLEHLTHPDDGIAFFQDASFGMAPTPVELAAAAMRLDVPVERGALGESGYARLESGDAVLLADLGVPAPAHQPGHAHAASLAFELSRGGQRLLVNTGTSTYEPGSRRAHERSTEAHNTIRVHERDQSELWAAFRVGARATLLERRHDGSTARAVVREASGAVLSRTIDRLPRGFLLRDEVRGEGRAPVELFFHAAPGVALDLDGRRAGFTGPAGEKLLLTLDEACNATLEDYQWSPQFGLTIPARRVRARWYGALPARFSTVIEFP